MKTWNQLIIRHGWKLEKLSENTFNCTGETKDNMDFLLEILDAQDVNYSFTNSILKLHSGPMTEEKWLQTVAFDNRGHSGTFWFAPGEEEPSVKNLDAHIAGIVRQLNRLGYFTSSSCDGHDKRNANVTITKVAEIGELVNMLTAFGKKRIHYRESRQHYTLQLPFTHHELLNLAEKLSLVKKEWIELGFDYINKQLFNSLVEELLSIPGESGHEQIVRKIVKDKLTPLVDHISIDRYGNLLAEKTYRNGHGPTILLNAHLDIAMELEPNRTILKENGIWTSSAGILGADDRAGIAVILQTAENLLQSSFSGKIKYIFTVEEECGLIGARNVEEYFLWDIDAAFVIDRRGESDIVRSCGRTIPFCNPEFGMLLEKIAKDAEMDEWKCTQGGSSDTRIWAEHGIQSVNLSAGYGNEHTEKEYLDINVCYKVTKLLKAVFSKQRELRNVVRKNVCFS